ncbi:cell division protein ZapA [Ruminiclostridium hungatei]|uniref:Cell division protein ZapA n=1 Tax=Ruminiclostridium hungatei TaxID=48256 RepID=A0A1V4SPS4_RUMHU|nr:cell division protein ZapA [Ruminiclostridium hungatei]OPX45850.1 cell division protein ZapA [Ruminiclostridium hungatei]
MTSKNKVVIRIAGKDYTLVGIESDEYIQKVGLYIDRKMNEILMRNNRLSTSLAAVLTAINVADDFFKTREEEVALRKEKEAVNEELERLRKENLQLKEENGGLTAKNTKLQLDLAKREAELGEVRNSIDKGSRSVVQKTLSGYDM